MSQSNAAKVVSMNLLFVLIEKISLLLNQTHIRSFFSLSATHERIMSPVLYSRWYTFLWIIYHTACYTNKQEITDSGLELQHATPRYFSSPVSGALFYISFELIFCRCLVWRYITSLWRPVFFHFSGSDPDFRPIRTQEKKFDPDLEKSRIRNIALRA